MSSLHPFPYFSLVVHTNIPKQYTLRHNIRSSSNMSADPWAGHSHWEWQQVGFWVKTWKAFHTPCSVHPLHWHFKIWSRRVLTLWTIVAITSVRILAGAIICVRMLSGYIISVCRALEVLSVVRSKESSAWWQVAGRWKHGARGRDTLEWGWTRVPPANGLVKCIDKHATARAPHITHPSPALPAISSLLSFLPARPLVSQPFICCWTVCLVPLTTSFFLFPLRCCPVSLVLCSHLFLLFMFFFTQSLLYLFFLLSFSSFICSFLSPLSYFLYPLIASFLVSFLTPSVHFLLLCIALSLLHSRSFYILSLSLDYLVLKDIS